MKETNKGINLLISDAHKDIAKIICDSGLPPSVWKYILTDLLNETIQTEKMEIAKEQEEYQKALSDKNKEKKGE